MAFDVRPQSVQLVPFEIGVWFVGVDDERRSDRLMDKKLPELFVQTLVNLFKGFLAGSAGQDTELSNVLLGSDAIHLSVVEPEALHREALQFVVCKAELMNDPGEVKSEIDGLQLAFGSFPEAVSPAAAGAVCSALSPFAVMTKSRIL